MVTFLLLLSFILVITSSMIDSYNRYMAMDITGSSFTSGEIWTEKQIKLDSPVTPKIGEIKKSKWGGKTFNYRWTSENSFLFCRCKSQLPTLYDAFVPFVTYSARLEGGHVNVVLRHGKGWRFNRFVFLIAVPFMFLVCIILGALDALGWILFLFFVLPLGFSAWNDIMKKPIEDIEHGVNCIIEDQTKETK